VITGPGTLTDVGVGPLTLAGTNTFNSLVMAGTNVLTLATISTNAGTVTVSSGTLLINAHLTPGAVTVQTNGTLGGSGVIDTSLGGNVTVQAGGAIQGGDANYTNYLQVSGVLSLGSASTDLSYSRFTVADKGYVRVFTLGVNGTNIVQILDPSLAIGTYTLFTYSGSIGGTSHFGGFQLGPLPAGVTAQLINPSGKVQLAVTATNSMLIPTIAPAITHFNLVGGTNVVISGTNGQVGYTYYLLTTTNLANPVSHWNTVATNVLGAGNYTFIGTNAASKSGQQFYRLSSTNYNPVNPY